MALYKGYSTKSFKFSNPTTIVGVKDNDFGPYNISDKDLIVADLLNHFNTRKGERLMNPTFGCIIWDRLFDPLTPELENTIIKDVSAIVNLDPRISVLNKVLLSKSPDGIGLLLSASFVIKSTNELVGLNMKFDGSTGVVNSQVNY